MARQPNDDFDEDRPLESDYERERLRGVARDEEESEEVESDEEDVDANDEDDGTY